MNRPANALGLDPVELEPITQHHTRTDIQQVIKDCLQRCSKDGLAWSHMENLESYSW